MVAEVSTQAEKKSVEQAKKGKPAQLWENHYSNSKFAFESSYLICTLALWVALIAKTLQRKPNPISPVAGFVFAQFLVDYISGMLHWACDTWGKFETPLVGPTLIRNFRMHHVDPQDITTHGFIETNASSTYPMPVFIALGLITECDSLLGQFYNWSIIFGVVLGIFTNEIHKWAHMVHSQPHKIVCFLQRSGLVLSHEKHHVHHTGNFDSNYCIINGWMNPILENINYWRNLEKLITWTTGAIPRADDQFWRDLKENTVV